MKIEKTKNGSYRIRKTYNKKTYSVYTKYKPTQKEALRLIMAEMDKEPCEKEVSSFKTAAEKYISVKENVLSPSTIVGYRGIIRTLSDSFCRKRVSDISSIDIQKEINDYSKGRAPKTVRNAHGFISAVLKMFSPSTAIHTTLPGKVKKESYIPSDDDVSRILKNAKGTEYECALILATFGLRRSEICALTKDDINGNIITINKAMVQDEKKKWVIKSTKTTDGTRTIYLPDALIEIIQSHEVIYSGHPNNIIRYLHRTQDALSIPRFPLHKLRHYYASMAHSIGIPDSYIMASGGWKSDNVLKSVYRHAMESKIEEMQAFAGEYLKEIIL